MKRILVGLCTLTLPIHAEAVGSHYVHGYFRKNGTYVSPHYQTNPDGNPYNNWSTRGNINPYTGKLGTKAPYERGYGNGSFAPTYSSPQYYAPIIPPSYPYISPPSNLNWNIPIQIPLPLIIEAHTNIQKTYKEGGMTGLQIMVDNCYKYNLNIKLCILEDIASYKMDYAVRLLFSKENGRDPGPAVNYFSEQNVELRLEAKSQGIFNTPWNFWTYYRNAPDIVWYPDNVYPWKQGNSN
ncbi:hypothetical protein APT_00776 [Acetobacter pasteurianus NBRC 101655]|uniref:hypothetical protein n=1 Tax=Acetobacter pasteurianus TaxID=438 RepID=UPI000245733F|nr:hypothetical protein [Acetobacter pasteurianus]BAU37858.1 hypothetical protein APT_00776 [Acetobacter pasteurianus NBRC 101655]